MSSYQICDVNLAGREKKRFLINDIDFYFIYLCRICDRRMIKLDDYEKEFEQLFRENYSRLCYHAYSFLNDEEAAKDVVNDVFEKVWVNFGRIEHSTSLLPLLYTWVRNSCVSQLRHRQANERFIHWALQKEEGEMPDEGNMEYEFLLERLRVSIEKLPDQTKIVFRKCFLEGEKYRKVAEELGISVNTIKTLINRALRSLRKEYSDDSLFLMLCFFKKNSKKSLFSVTP